MGPPGNGFAVNVVTRIAADRVLRSLGMLQRPRDRAAAPRVITRLRDGGPARGVENQHLLEQVLSGAVFGRVPRLVNNINITMFWRQEPEMRRARNGEGPLHTLTNLGTRWKVIRETKGAPNNLLVEIWVGFGAEWKAAT